MRVITLNPKQFSEACQRLAQRVMAHNPAGFDYIIAIPRGGRFVAKEMMRFLPGCEYAEIKLQRPSTKNKKGDIDKVLKKLPTWLTDFLRMVESFVLQFKHKRVPQVEIRTGNISAHCKRILIVDDAVDSGCTLMAVKRAVERVCPEANVRTAVITVTTKHPVIEPDERVFDAPVLVRYHWSADYKSTRDGDN